MSLPSFDDNPVSVDLSILPSSGSGNRLPIWLLALCGSFTAVGKYSEGKKAVYHAIPSGLLNTQNHEGGQRDGCGVKWEYADNLATAISVMSMTLQLKNYRKPALQRAVVRIMVMCV
jgi:hypothetical protein